MKNRSALCALIVATALAALGAACSADPSAGDAAPVAVHEAAPPPTVAGHRAEAPAPLAAGVVGQWGPPSVAPLSASAGGAATQDSVAAVGAPVVMAPRPLLSADQAAAGLPGAAGAVAPLPSLAAPVMGPEARLSALEGQVADLRHEFDSMLPAIRALIAQRETANAAGHGALSAQHADVPAAQPEPAAVSRSDVSPAVKSAVSRGAWVDDVRVGVHPGGKTRIVLDVGAPVEPGHDLDNTEKLFIVDLPGLEWKTAMQKTLAPASIVSSYSAQPSSDGKGSTVVFQLRQAAKILSSTRLKPDGGKGHRIVIDLVAQ